MAEASEKTTGTGNTAVPHEGDHDRVVMLSLRADGTPDQHNPEIIGDKEFALEAAKRQFAEQAVSAVDVAKRGVTADTGAETVGQDPTIEELQKAHDKAASAAESAAEKTVNALYQEDEQPENSTAPGADKPASRTSRAKGGS